MVLGVSTSLFHSLFRSFGFVGGFSCKGGFVLNVCSFLSVCNYTGPDLIPLFFHSFIAAYLKHNAVFFFSVFRHEATAGEAADPGGQRPHALGPRVLGRQVDPNHDVSVGAEEHRWEGLGLCGDRFADLRPVLHPHCLVCWPQLAARLR